MALGMRRTSEPAPTCHLAHVPGPGRHGQPTRAAVWICEYPYRTMRMDGPSSDCVGCPVWQELERARLAALSSAAREEIRQLESLLVP